MAEDGTQDHDQDQDQAEKRTEGPPGDGAGGGSRLRVGILVVSDRVSRGEATDRTGPLIRDWCRDRGLEPAHFQVVADGTHTVAPVLARWADSGQVELIITTGGTGFSPRDVTPEATRAVVERPSPGISQALWRRGLESTPYAVLSRGCAGLRGRCLIVNLPGSPSGVRDGLDVLTPLLRHGSLLARGRDDSHQAPSHG